MTNADGSPSAELLAAVFGDHPRPRILGALYDTDEDYLNQAEIARLGGFNRSSLSRYDHLDQLEQHGLVEETRSENQVHYRLTQTGHEVLGAFLEQLNDKLPE